MNSVVTFVGVASLFVACGPGGTAQETKALDASTAAADGQPAIRDACFEQRWFRDQDGDGFGSASEPQSSCEAPAGYVADSTDCDDSCADCNPGALEICGDTIDNDCHGGGDDGCACKAGDSRVCRGPDVGECVRGLQTCVDGRWSSCEGEVLPVAEVCDGLDNDCDGTSDEGLEGTYYIDEDGDGFGHVLSAVTNCDGPVGLSTAGGDCDDARIDIAPGAAETCDEADNDCDGQTDEQCSCVTGDIRACGTDVGECTAGMEVCTDGEWGTCTGAVASTVETCDGLDNDCDGTVDEGLSCNPPGIDSFDSYIKTSISYLIYDHFGQSVVLSSDGSTLVVGASTQPRVEIFRRVGWSWAPEQMLAPNGPFATDAFSDAVAISGDGNVLVVGAPSDDSCPPGSTAYYQDCINSGSVYVFRRSGSTWAQEAELKVDPPNRDQRAGDAVAISQDGNTIAIGARGDNSIGAAFVFRSEGGARWTQEAKIRSTTYSVNDYQGTSVALSSDGNVLLVGAPGARSGRGSAFVFHRSGGLWAQEAELQTSSGTSGHLGSGVALSADGAIASLAAERDAYAYIFASTGSTWNLQATLDSHGGSTIAMNAGGDFVAIGSKYASGCGTGINPPQDSSCTDAGAVYAFQRNGSAWTEQAYIKAPNAGARDEFGYAVSLSSDGLLAVGAYFEDGCGRGVNPSFNVGSCGGAGAVYTFR